MRRRPAHRPSSIEIEFASTPDGLVVSRVVLRAANADAERELRWFLDRHRDPALDLASFVRPEREPRPR